MNTEAQVAYEVARDGIVVESFPTYYEAVKAYTEFVDDKAK